MTEWMREALIDAHLKQRTHMYRIIEGFAPAAKKLGRSWTLLR